MFFSGIDKALLQRAARLLESQAAGIEKSKTNGGNWAGARAAKREFDALMRDARDLRSAVKRFAAPATPRKPRVPKVDTPVSDTPASDDGVVAAGFGVNAGG